MISISEIFDFRHSTTRAITSLHFDMSAIDIRTSNEASDDSPTFREKIYLYNIAIREKCTATDLVKVFGVSKVIVSQALALMESKGLIAREKDSVDSRKHIITIVPDKLGKFADEIALFDDAMDLTLKDCTEEELDIATKVLLKLSDNLSMVSKNTEKK